MHGNYGDNVEEMDWSVGEIVSSLKEENLLENTMVYFTSDHGPHLEETVDTGEYCGGWRGLYKGGMLRSESSAQILKKAWQKTYTIFHSKSLT